MYLEMSLRISSFTSRLDVSQVWETVPEKDQREGVQFVVYRGGETVMGRTHYD